HRRVVLDHQHHGPAGGTPALGELPGGDDLDHCNRRLGQAEVEAAALSLLALDPDAPPVQLPEASCQSQAQARAAYPGHVFVELVELLEDALLVSQGN